MNEPDIVPGMLLTFTEDEWIFATTDVNERNHEEIPQGALAMALTSRHHSRGGHDSAYVLASSSTGWVDLCTRERPMAQLDFDVVWSPEEPRR